MMTDENKMNNTVEPPSQENVPTTRTTQNGSSGVVSSNSNTNGFDTTPVAPGYTTWYTDKNFNANAPQVPSAAGNANAPAAPNTNGAINGAQQTDPLKELLGENSFAGAAARFNERRKNFITNNPNAVSMLDQQYKDLLGTVTAAARQRMRNMGQQPNGNELNVGNKAMANAVGMNGAVPQQSNAQPVAQQQNAQTVAQQNGVTTETVNGKPSSNFTYGNVRIAIPDGIDVSDNNKMLKFINAQKFVVDYMNNADNDEKEDI